MGSKERIHRIKENTKVNIINAAHDIVKEEGWQALSMRKIAEKIEYTAFHMRIGSLQAIDRGVQIIAAEFGELHHLNITDTVTPHP